MKKLIAIDIPICSIADSEIVSGGSSSSVLISAIKICHNPSSVMKTILIALIGDDELVSRLEEYLLRNINEVSLIQQNNAKTLTIEDNLLFTRYFCSLLLEDMRIYQTIINSDYIFFPGKLLIAFEGIDLLLQLSNHIIEYMNTTKQRKCILYSFNGLESIYKAKDRLDAFLPFVDYLFLTEKQALEYGDVYFGIDDMPLSEVALSLVSLNKLSSYRPRIVVIVKSDSSSIVVTVGAIFEVPKLSISISESCSNMDAFVGGFIGTLISIETEFEKIRSKNLIRSFRAKDSDQEIKLKPKKDSPEKKKQFYIRKNKEYSKKELKEFYENVIFPVNNKNNGDKLSENSKAIYYENNDHSNDFQQTTLASPSTSPDLVCVGVKTLTECVLGGQYSSSNSSDVFALNFQTSFYGIRP